MSTVTAVPLQPVRRSVLVYLWLGIALAVIAAVALAWQAPRDQVAVDLAKIRGGDAAIQMTASGLMYKVIKPGTGDAHPTDADIVLVTYDGKLLDGTAVGASAQPSPMPIKGNLPGISEALKLMAKGAKYKVWIKPSLGYGDKVTGPIPANSILVFDLELLDWKSEAEVRQMQQMQQMMQQQGGAPGAGGAPGGAVPPQGVQ